MDNQRLYTVSKTHNPLLRYILKWDVLAEASLKRRLSVHVDRIEAISGLTAYFSRLRPEDEYMAGLWRGNRPKGLCWIPVGSESPLAMSAGECLSARTRDSFPVLGILGWGYQVLWQQ